MRAYLPIGSQNQVDVIGFGHVGKRSLHNVPKRDIAIGDESVEIDPPDPVVLAFLDHAFDHGKLVPHCSTNRDIDPVVDCEGVVVLFRIR